MPYLARRDLADSPSWDRRDWKRPASRPYFSVVSSAVGEDLLAVVVSSSVWRA